MTVVAILVVLYFLPAIIGRHKQQSRSIFWANFLFGWTMIGWIICLIWAVSAEKKPSVNASDAPFRREDLLGSLNAMRHRGTISNDAYWEERKRYSLL